MDPWAVAGLSDWFNHIWKWRPRTMLFRSALALAALSYAPCFAWVRMQLASEGMLWPLATILDTVRWLGKISHSLYLVHLPILLLVMHFLSGWSHRAVASLPWKRQANGSDGASC